MWAVTLPETKDRSFSYFTQCVRLSEQPTCLLSYTCPCRCLTTHLVFNRHGAASPPFFSPIHYLFLTLQVYRQRRRSVLTVASQSHLRLLCLYCCVKFLEKRILKRLRIIGPAS